MKALSRSLVRLSIIAILASAAVGLASCDADDGDGDGTEAQVQALTTLEIFADMVRNVGGERVDAEALLPSGADVHTYELPPNRVADIVDADVVFINGLALEEAFEDVVTNNASGPVVELSEGLLIVDGGQSEVIDSNPHLWLDVRLAARYVERIRDELLAIDPEGTSVYEANATAYLEELGNLDREIEETVSEIPEANRTLVTFHDAFPYFATRYGLEVVVAVTSPGQEPSARAIAELVEQIEDVPAVFTEPQFNSEVLELAAEDADVEVFELLSDAYIDDVDSYIAMMRFNEQQLREGLGGD